MAAYYICSYWLELGDTFLNQFTLPLMVDFNINEDYAMYYYPQLVFVRSRWDYVGVGLYQNTDI